jgi:hypothetical protein
MQIKKVEFVMFAILMICVEIYAIDFGNKTGPMWEHLEWQVDNVTYSGNAFDIAATATFSHSGSSARHVTELFYTGGQKWKFRFTGTQTGTWTFTTQSSNTDLNGHSGTVTVTANSNPRVTGFLTHQGNKYAVPAGPEGKLKAFRLNVFQTDDSGPYKHTHITSFGSNPADKMKTYAQAALDNGMSAVYVMLNNNVFKWGAYSTADHSSDNPDLRTFDVLDTIIFTAHRMGVRIYFWAWGDQSRNWVPKGGINGTADQRMQQYLAARLGPLPGWSMGYGFDLMEWVSESQLNTWAGFLQDHFGWGHLLSARAHGFPSNIPNIINGYSIEDKEHDDFYQLNAYPDVVTIAADLNKDSSRPHLYEERHVLDRWGVDETKTRRLIWRNTLAGGMGGWWGFFQQDPVWGSGSGYSNAEHLRIASVFWDKKGRFILGMKRADHLTDGHCLKTDDNKHYVFYREGASSIQYDLSGMADSYRAVAVDARMVYGEIDLGLKKAVQHTWTAPYSSDWALAVGDFANVSGITQRGLKTLKESDRDIKVLAGTGSLEIQLPFKGKFKMALFNVFGQCLYSCAGKGKRHRIHRSLSIPSGIYLLNVILDKRHYAKKVVVLH